MAPWLPSGRIRAHEHERGGFSAGALTSDGLRVKSSLQMFSSRTICFKNELLSLNFVLTP